MKVLNIIVANPRGFCAGVRRAIDIVEKALIKFGAPIYVRHEIVHNVNVVRNLTEKGVVFVEDIADVPSGCKVIFSAHGSPKKLFADAAERNLTVIDATCPLVIKVHKNVEFHEENGDEIIIIGHKNHVEVIGTSGQVPSQALIVENEEDARKIIVQDASKLAYVTQTTLSVDDTKGIVKVLKERFPDIKSQKEYDLCYATQNRQDAIKKIINKVQAMFVVGSNNSSNSNRLREIADKYGKNGYLIDSYADVDLAWLNGVDTIGISAGASAPEYLVDDLLKFFSQHFNTNITQDEGEPENVVFHLPKIVRD
jgi:4-hydroxy-3-methylbut-2-enyl diphosphate reductase